MAGKKIAGMGRKRPQLNLPVTRLYLDPLNPRLPEEIQGGKEGILLGELYKEFDLDELAFSLAQNGYFDEEPIVAIPNNIPKSILKSKNYWETEEFSQFINDKNTEFTVVEGNRRLATIKILLSAKEREQLGAHWPKLTDAVSEDIREIPAIIYPTRKDVIPYLGVRHIAGIKRWDSYAKSRYIAGMREDGLSLDEIQNQMGDKQNSARKHYLCYKLVEQAQSEFDIDIDPVKANFSYLMLATGQGNIKRYLGLPVKLKDVNWDEPVPHKNLSGLKNLLSWLFGEGKDVSPAIEESRDITNYLAHVVANKESASELEKNRDLKRAYELSDGEESMLKRALNHANRKLELALGIAHLHKTPEVVAEIKRSKATVDRLLESVAEPKE